MGKTSDIDISSMFCTGLTHSKILWNFLYGHYEMVRPQVAEGEDSLPDGPMEGACE
jgi:hypothetical protein